MKQGTITPIKANRSKSGHSASARTQPASMLALLPPTSATKIEIAAISRKDCFTTATINEDAILSRIENGESIAAIAASLGVDRSTLSRWLNADEHRSARAREARQAAAAAFDEQAEQELRSATDLFQLAKARELAQHLRWRASKINPKAYGDRLEVEAADKPETLAQALKRLNDMKVPPHAPMPIIDEADNFRAQLPVVSPPPSLAAAKPDPRAWREPRPARRF